MVPTVALPLGTEFTCQFTAGLFAFCTFALNCTVPPAFTSVAGADTVTVAAGGAMAADEVLPPPDAQEIRTGGSSRIPRKATARWREARRCLNEDGMTLALSRSMGAAISGSFAKSERGKRNCESRAKLALANEGGQRDL